MRLRLLEAIDGTQDERGLALFVSPLDALRHILCGLALCADRHHDRPPQVALGDALDGRRHRRREHVRCSVRLLRAEHLLLFIDRLEVGRRHRREHIDDLRLKAEIYHAVCLIEHHVVALVEHGVRAADAVKQAAGRRDDDLGTAAQLADLVLV